MKKSSPDFLCVPTSRYIQWLILMSECQCFVLHTDQQIVFILRSTIKRIVTSASPSQGRNPSSVVRDPNSCWSRLVSEPAVLWRCFRWRASWSSASWHATAGPAVPAHRGRRKLSSGPARDPDTPSWKIIADYILNRFYLKHTVSCIHVSNLLLSFVDVFEKTGALHHMNTPQTTEFMRKELIWFLSEEMCLWDYIR